MPKTAVAIRHVHFEDLGVFRPAIEAAGYAIRYCEAGSDDLDALHAEDADLLVVLGAPIGAYDEDKYPFVRSEITLLESRLAARRPTLGICLGAQLMARALGARVYPGPAKEIGWGPVTLTSAGFASPLRVLGEHPVLHWHGDTFDLPDHAERLASTALCVNQAFALGGRALAFQFHPEADGRNIEHWLIGHAVEISAAGVCVAVLREETLRFAREAAQRGRRCLDEWLGGIAQN
jgi:GMP synthase (glutamine-hydrolysing)